jgi:predicted transposase
MVRAVTCALKPTSSQVEALLATMEAFNAACDYVSSVAWTEREFNNYRLRKRAYRAIRERYGLPAQLAQQAIARVAAAYKVSKRSRAEFRPHGAVTFDCRCLRLIGVSVVSLTLLTGREKVALSVGGYQAARLKGATLGETDLTYQPEKRRFRLHFSVKSPAPEVMEPKGVLGVDLGITNLAVTSDGAVFSSAPVRALRRRHLRLRAKLQAKGTRGANRTCPACGPIDKANRKSQSVFSCVLCQCSGLADLFAALEIQRRAACKPATLRGEGQGTSQGKAALL